MALASDQGAFAKTGATCVESEITLSGTGITQPNSNAPYALSAFGVNGVLARVVAAGMRVRPIYAETDLNGQVYAMRHPDNRSLAGFTATEMAAYAESGIFPVTNARKWIGVVWKPVNPDESEFVSDLTAQSSKYCLGLMVQGRTPAQGSDLYAVEMYVIAEYIGPNVNSKTLSLADPQGFSAVLNASELEGDTRDGSWAGFAHKISAVAGNMLSAMSGAAQSPLGQTLVRGAANVVANRLNGNPGQYLTVEELKKRHLQNGGAHQEMLLPGEWGGNFGPWTDDNPEPMASGMPAHPRVVACRAVRRSTLPRRCHTEPVVHDRMKPGLATLPDGSEKKCYYFEVRAGTFVFFETKDTWTLSSPETIMFAVSAAIRVDTAKVPTFVLSAPQRTYRFQSLQALEPWLDSLGLPRATLL
jgi:hypothetical protein